jgi:hypothetical protein
MLLSNWIIIITFLIISYWGGVMKISKNKSNVINFLWLLIPFIIMPVNFAHAYLDPGTGSYVIQIVIGVVFGAAYTIKSYGSSILQKIRLWGSKTGRKK